MRRRERKKNGGIDERRKNTMGKMIDRRKKGKRKRE